MVFGDGNEFIYDFTASVDVIAHEISHALTDQICPLEYEGQSGALNEHLSDAFGVMVRQRVKNQTSDQADWLIGEDCLFPGVHGVGLRSLKAPGTAYDDPRIVCLLDSDSSSALLFRAIAKSDARTKIFRSLMQVSFEWLRRTMEGYTNTPASPTKLSISRRALSVAIRGIRQGRYGGMP